MSEIMAPTFFYFLSTQFENFGDLVINRECLRLLRGSGQLIVHTSGAPANFLAELEVGPAERSPGRLAFLRRLITNARSGRPTYLVLVPGAVAGGLTRGQWARHLGLATGYQALAMLGVKIIRLGASMEPLTRRREPIERWKSRAMHFIGLRDRLSLAAASKGNLEHVALFPDFAWMLSARNGEIDRNSSNIFLSFRAASEAELDDIATAVGAYLRRVDPDRTLTLTMVSQVERDREPCRALAERIGEGYAVQYLDVSEGERVLLKGYASAGGVLSNRLHVLMFAARQGAPIRAFVHPNRNQKIIGLFEDVGLEDRLVDITKPGEINMAPFPDNPINPVLFEQNRQEIEAQFAAMLKR